MEFEVEQGKVMVSSEVAAPFATHNQIANTLGVSFVQALNLSSEKLRTPNTGRSTCVAHFDEERLSRAQLQGWKVVFDGNDPSKSWLAATPPQKLQTMLLSCVK
eukprot:5934953-Amphidinium_carterae.1